MARVASRGGGVRSRPLLWHALIFAFVAPANANAPHYKTLGVGTRAKPDEIKSAYRALALKYHPDKVSKIMLAAQSMPSILRSRPAFESIQVPPSARDAAVQRFERINEAYETLSDPVKRRQYDMQQSFGGFMGQQQQQQHGRQSAGFDPRFDPRFQAFARAYGRGFPQPPAVTPPRARRPFYCSLAELDTGCHREFTLRDTPWTRLRDAVADGFQGASGEALWRTVTIAASVAWRFPNLCFRRSGMWLRMPALVAAFVAALAQQLPQSPSGRFEFDVRPGWRGGTRVVFKSGSGGGGGSGTGGEAEAHAGEARAVAFELRERRHRRISRLADGASGKASTTGDLLWIGTLSYSRALAGTTLTIVDLHGAAHELELRLTPEEQNGAVTRIRRRVGTGLGLPRKKKKGGGERTSGGEPAEAERGDLFVEITLSGGPAVETTNRRQRDFRRAS